MIDQLITSISDALNSQRRTNAEDLMTGLVAGSMLLFAILYVSNPKVKVAVDNWTGVKNFKGFGGG